MGVKQIKDENLVAANLMIQGELLCEDLRLKSQTFEDCSNKDKELDILVGP